MRSSPIAASLLVVASLACTSGRSPEPEEGSAVASDHASRAASYGSGTDAARRFARTVDEYLDGWARLYPSIAAGNGLHMHDAELEDFSAEAMLRQAAWFREMKERLAAIPADSLAPDERVDQRILGGVIDGWLLDIEVARSWQRNPMIYASALSDGVHNLMTMESAPPEARMVRITSKLRRVPRLLAAARANLVNPPRALAERGASMMRGASGMLEHDLALAFPGAKGEAWEDLEREASTAKGAIDDFVAHLERVVVPNAAGEIALGASYVEARYRAEELIDLPVDRLLEIGRRELAREQALFAAKAREIDATREPLAVWGEVRKEHARRGELVAATRRAVDTLRAFVVAKRLVALPSDEPVIVEPSKPFDIGLASMHASPPLEPVPVKSIFYVTDARAEWPAEQQDRWLERFNTYSLTITAAHEAMPGHFVHALYMRATPGKVRRIWIGLNPFPQPSSGQDGWAHYAEQLVVEQGLMEGDPRYALAQLSESMTRICRLIASISVHTKGWSVAQAAKFFEDEAHIPAPAALQEATRVVYDPTNGGYFLGKRAMLTLREDVQAREGERFDLADFHARVLRNGIAPWWAHRALLLPGDTGVVLR